MHSPKEIDCPYCNSKASCQSDDEFKYVFVECPVCGRYNYLAFPSTIGNNMKDEIASYLYYTGTLEKHDDRRFFNFIGYKEDFDSKSQDCPWAYYVSLEEINAFYPHTFSERITKILLGVAKKSDFIGDFLYYTRDEFLSLMFIKRHDKNGELLEEEKVSSQLMQIMKYLKDREYLNIASGEKDFRIMLPPEGWKRVDELQSDEKNNENVFVSMAFNDGTKETREALRNGIINAGYSPKFIDEIIHNKQIVPEMFRLIRESRFLILEITDPNYGAYYEAGYALGLGKEVIICCKEEIFTKKYETDEEQKYQRYLQPHFDIAQKQILVWKDYKDLTLKLAEWIKAIIS